MPWCKGGTIVFDSVENSQICILGPIRGARNRLFPVSNAQCVYCTENAIAFLDTPYPQLPFDMNNALVQRRYNCFRQRLKFPTLHSQPYARCTTPGYLPGSNAQCVYCTENAIAFLCSPYPQLPIDMNIALVPRQYHCFRQR